MEPRLSALGHMLLFEKAGPREQPILPLLGFSKGIAKSPADESTLGSVVREPKLPQMDFKSDQAMKDLAMFLGAILRLITLAPAISGQLASAETAASTAGIPDESERWSSFLPLMSDMVADPDQKLPLPFGVSEIYHHIERDIEIQDLRVGPVGSNLQSVGSFSDLGSTSKVDVALERFDVWMLPFLNIYGLAGYVSNHTVTRGAVPVPGPKPQIINFMRSTERDAFVGGLGMTLAGGYKRFFMMADVNCSQADLGFDDEFRAIVVSARAGWKSEIGEVPVRLWVGATYWDTDNTVKSKVEIPGKGIVQFEADHGPANPWNASLGAAVSLSDHWEWFGEYGFNLDDVRIVTTGLTFRF